jgi:hypothetical protein
MADQPTQRSSCRFEAKAPRNGAPTLRLELFHPVSSLAGMTLEFELLSGTTFEQAKKLAESVNERTIGIIVNAKGNDSTLP